MSFSLSPLLMMGVGAILTAFFVLYRMVHWELAPSARLVGNQRWLLIAALGAGVITFTIKMIAIVILSGVFRGGGEVRELASQTSGESRPPGIAEGFAWTMLPETEPGIRLTASNKAYAYVWQPLPDKAPSPTSNPTTPEKVALGKRLFNDPLLSRDQTLSCASCHDLETQAGADGRQTALGINNQTGARNTPTIWNTAFQSLLFWDGRAPSIEE